MQRGEATSSTCSNRTLEMLGLHQSMVDETFSDIIQSLSDAIPNSSAMFSVRYFGKSVVHGFAGDIDDPLEKMFLALNSRAMASGKRIFELTGITEYTPSRQVPLDFIGMDTSQYAGVTVTTPDGTRLGVIGLLLPSSESLDNERWMALQRAGRIVENIIRYRIAAGIDPLTQLCNRGFFDDNLNIEWNIARGKQSTLGVMMIDIDHFKLINDSYGHSAGDRCLKVIADTLANGLNGKGCLVGRYGGEEFVAVVPNTCTKALTEHAEKLRKTIANLHIPELMGHKVTVSIGMSQLSDTHTKAAKSPHAKNPEQALRFADEALYKAKTMGRNATLLYSKKYTWDESSVLMAVSA